MSDELPRITLDTALAALLEQSRHPETLDVRVVQQWLELRADEFDERTVETLTETLMLASESVRTGLGSRLKDLPFANARYLLAELASRERQPAQAVDAWRRFFDVYATPSHRHRLSLARALVETGEFEEARRQLVTALSPPVPYSFFARIQRLVSKLKTQAIPVRPECRVALVGTTTTELLAQVFETLCFRDGLLVRTYRGLYGAATQEILDNASGLHTFKPNIVFLLTHWRDLNLPGLVPDAEATVASVIAQQRSLWDRLISNAGCHVVQMAYDYPRLESYGYLASAESGGRARLLEAINAAMRVNAPAGVSILDSPSLQRQVGITRWENSREWYMFKQHPGTEALPDLAEEMMAHVRSLLGLTKKVLAVDLDNTLWQGVIGEDGIDNIRLGPGDPAGEAHQELQRYLLELKQRGIVLAVCSKNNPEDARLPFEKHPHTVLRVDDFAMFEASWDDKAQSLRKISGTLSLGLDSFVFLDDSPTEREWIRSQLPQVAVIEPGTSVFDYAHALERGRLFFALSLSKEDLQRAQQYRVQAQRESLRHNAESLEDFLSGLQLHASFDAVNPANLARVVQLINKTNQYNLTTRRFTEAEVVRLANDPRNWASAFRLSDRFGDYGQVGVILCEETEPQVWEVNTWLLSCRALGRQMERFMFNCLLDAAVTRGIRSIRGVYRPTAKNSLVAGHYESLGFAVTSTEPNATGYEYAVSAEPEFLSCPVSSDSPNSRWASAQLRTALRGQTAMPSRIVEG